MILYPKIGIFGTTIEKSILVKNVNNVSVNITMEASEEIKDIIEVIDKQFTLAPGENKDAQFLIKLRKAGDYAGKITVQFTAAEGEKANVGLISNIIIHAEKQGFWDDSEESDDDS